MKEQITNNLAHRFSGPLLFDYVWWVLKEAMARDISTLYFLARDGYLLREIALRFCKTFDLNIECKYLYCSRASLRMPTYHLIGDEALDLLLLGGYRLTLRSILLRADLDVEKRAEIYQECGLQNIDENSRLNKAELSAIRKKLRQSRIYRAEIMEKSHAAYSDTIGYLKQEGMLKNENIAVVDSGWTGSMQRSLRQLLESQAFCGTLTGFYFGMYAPPRSKNDGTYLTYYFNHESRPGEKIPFCNNLFECLLSAPHGMTCGYASSGDNYEPVLMPCSAEDERRAREQIDGVLKYTEQRLNQIKLGDFSLKESKRNADKLIRRYMMHPSIEEAEYYGQFMFCDDITEAYKFSLAEKTQVAALKKYMLPTRIIRKVFRCGNSTTIEAELFWPYGTIALLPKWKQAWYRLNIYVWEWMRYVLL